MKVKLLSHIQPFATLYTVAHQAPPSMGFSRQEYWSGLPFPSPGVVSSWIGERPVYGLSTQWGAVCGSSCIGVMYNRATCVCVCVCVCVWVWTDLKLTKRNQSLTTDSLRSSSLENHRSALEAKSPWRRLLWSRWKVNSSKGRGQSRELLSRPNQQGSEPFSMGAVQENQGWLLRLKNS